jgi:hypothetical protein
MLFAGRLRTSRPIAFSEASRYVRLSRYVPFTARSKPLCPFVAIRPLYRSNRWARLNPSTAGTARLRSAHGRRVSCCFNLIYPSYQTRHALVGRPLQDNLVEYGRVNLLDFREHLSQHGHATFLSFSACLARLYNLYVCAQVPRDGDRLPFLPLHGQIELLKEKTTQEIIDFLYIILDITALITTEIDHINESHH